MRLLALAGALALLLAAAPRLPVARRAARFAPDQARGAAWHAASGSLFAWGRDLTVVRLPSGQPRTLARHINAAPGGCVLDANGDGQPDVLHQESDDVGRLVVRLWPSYRRQLVDDPIQFRDCLPATLHGRRGVLLIHRYNQLRFYEPAAQPGGPWLQRDLYSFYTPSRQGGLLLADVDADGRTDIHCGNYWVRSPERFELAWPLYAINTYTEQEDSALLSLALLARPDQPFPTLVVTEGGLSAGRLALFDRPADPRQLWHQRVLATGLRHPRGLALVDLDHNGRPEIVVSEAHPDGHLHVFREREGRWTADQTPAPGAPFLLWSAARPGAFWSVGHSLLLWR